jgi:hypothetical protein
LGEAKHRRNEVDALATKLSCGSRGNAGGVALCAPALHCAAGRNIQIIGLPLRICHCGERESDLPQLPVSRRRNRLRSPTRSSASMLRDRTTRHLSDGVRPYYQRILQNHILARCSKSRKEKG